MFVLDRKKALTGVCKCPGIKVSFIGRAEQT